jgi:hypothetical protein
MADLAQLDLRAQGEELKLRALLEDLISYHKGVYPGHRLAIAVWFGKSPKDGAHNVLELFSGLRMSGIALSERQSLAWKTGSNEPPFVNIHATSVQYFTEQLASNPPSLEKYFDNFEVLYFDKRALNDEITKAFHIITEPSGLVKGWYVRTDDYAKTGTIGELLASWGPTRPHIGLLKTDESPDFEFRRGVLHIEVEQRWVPLAPGSLQNYQFNRDLQDGNPGYFLFEGGSLYLILKFEVVSAPEYSGRVLEKLRNDRYVEVYLRAVHSPERPKA